MNQNQNNNKPKGTIKNMKKDITKKINQNPKENKYLYYKKPTKLTKTKIYNLPSIKPLTMFYGGVALYQKKQERYLKEGKTNIKGRFIQLEIDKFIDIIGSNKKEIIRKIKVYQRELLDYKIEVEQEQGVLALNFISKVFYEKKRQTISIVFNENIEIWNQKNNWNSNLLSNLKEYKSKYSILFYELIKANIKQNYLKQGTLNIYLNDLMDYLGVGDSKTYKFYNNFKTLLLDRAIKEMESIHNIKLIKFQALKEQVKGSKKINYLSFTFDYSNEKIITPKNIIRNLEQKKIIPYNQDPIIKDIGKNDNESITITLKHKKEMEKIITQQGETLSNQELATNGTIDNFLENIDFDLAIETNPHYKKNKGDN